MHILCTLTGHVWEETDRKIVSVGKWKIRVLIAERCKRCRSLQIRWEDSTRNQSEDDI